MPPPEDLAALGPAADESGSYGVGRRNRVKRGLKRAAYDRTTVRAILDSAMLCHVAYVIDGRPLCTPTIHWRKGETLYWHGSSAARMLRHQADGAPACLTVSHMDGIVFARSGFSHSLNYRSAMCFGHARLLDDPDEKREALDDVVDRFFPDRAATLRQPTAQEIKATSVVAMEIEDASAKVRDGGPGDEGADLEHPVWAGVAPIRQVLGALQPCANLAPGLTPGEDLAPYAEDRRLDEALLETQARYMRT